MDGSNELTKRRAKLEIMLSVLRAVQKGVDKPTRIMYAANMSWNPTQEVLKKLVEEGYLSVFDEPSDQRAKRRYFITEKGLSVLRYFDGAEKLIQI